MAELWRQCTLSNIGYNERHGCNIIRNSPIHRESMKTPAGTVMLVADMTRWQSIPTSYQLDWSHAQHIVTSQDKICDAQATASSGENSRNSIVQCFRTGNICKCSLYLGVAPFLTGYCALHECSFSVDGLPTAYNTTTLTHAFTRIRCKIYVLYIFKHENQCKQWFGPAMRQYGEDNQSKSKIFDWISWQPATLVGVFGCSSFISGPRIIITLQTVNGNVNALKILINFVWIWYELPYVAQCHLNMFSTEQKSICRLSCAWEEYGLMMSFVVACSLGSLSLTHTRPGVTHANTFERNICN